jgi:glucose/arabinose dehydrogenase
MRILIVVAVLLSLLILGGSVWWRTMQPQPAADPLVVSIPTTATGDSVETMPSSDAPRVSVVAENLSIPWEVLVLPSGDLVVTERTGTVVLLRSGTRIPIAGVRHVGEGGLLGAALHPAFTENGYVYLYHTTEHDTGLENRVVRYVLSGTDLTFDRIIFAGIPGARFHDGGRIAFGPDGNLYVTVGDALEPALAQDPENLAGSILRITPEGLVPADNPFGNAVYSYGHRNPQGLAWDASGQLWSSEHGRSGVRSGFDELNRIVPGSNFGWPDSEGDVVAPRTIPPVRHSGEAATWAPGGLAYLGGSLYMPGLRGEALYEAVVDNGIIVSWHEHFVGEYGRLRSVTAGTDGYLYLTTSNRDGRGEPGPGDDKILRINPLALSRD